MTPESVQPVVQRMRMRTYLLVALIAVLAVVAYLVWRGGPRPDPAPTTACPSSTLAPEPACDPSAPVPPRNDMPKNDMPKNGLSAASLMQNQALLLRLSTSKLAPTLFSDPAWHPLLTQVHAADLVKYIASCALDPCDALAIPNVPALATLRSRFPDGFTGELGLCGDRYGRWAEERGVPHAGDPPWQTSAPSPECLDRVSACVLARVNAVEASVVFSMRGDGMSFLDRVPTQTMYRENHGTPIVSFERCDALCLWGDPLRRNCDWQPRLIGQCVRGTMDDERAEAAGGARSAPPRRVKLALPPTARGRIRVCSGIYGCDDHAPGAGPATPGVMSNGHYVSFPPDYGGALITQGQDAVEFECPGNGPKVGNDRTGYYAVMVAGPTAAAAIKPDADVKLVSGGGLPNAYPATEEAVFTFREGGFYGSLFSAPPVASCPDTAMLAGHQYACFSSIWSAGAAALADRLCAGPSGADCFVNDPGPCDEPAPTGVCDPSAPPPTSGPIYDVCDGSALAWQRPYTSYLNHPCDLSTSQDACRAGLSVDVWTALPTGRVVPSASGGPPNPDTGPGTVGGPR